MIKLANNLANLVIKQAKREASKERSLHDWFSRKGETGSKGGWVDCNAPDGSGGYKTCGRSSGEERGEYPACRPTPGACKEKGRGDSWGKKSEEDEKDDACTRKVKARYDVWPSAYASGALTRCREVGAANWGNKTKESSINMLNNLIRLAATKEAESSAWQRAEGKNPAGGLNRKGVAAYRAANPGSKLQMAVTTEPSKLDPDSKPAKRRKSFCARMGGMAGPMEDEKGRPTRKALALRKWNC